ncbi:MAG: NYN domain-containing protein [Maritimibacter sp.]
MNDLVAYFDALDSEALILISVTAVVFVLLVLRVLRAFARLTPKKTSSAAPVPKKPIALIDGSNIMYWNDNTPKIATVRKAVQALRKAGFEPGVMFDANAGYLLSGHYQHDGEMAKALDLSPKNVMVVPKGTPADPYLLTAARDLGARIVTNDKFRDWADQYPEVKKRGHLIKGRWTGAGIELDLTSK